MIRADYNVGGWTATGKTRVVQWLCFFARKQYEWRSRYGQTVWTRSEVGPRYFASPNWNQRIGFVTLD